MNRYDRWGDDASDGCWTMPFGKYRGTHGHDLPLSYLAWLFQEADLRPSLRDLVRDELRRRLLDDDDDALAVPRLEMRSEIRETAREIISAGFRTLTSRLHPDVGGSDAAMRSVLEARDALRQAVGA